MEQIFIAMLVIFVAGCIYLLPAVIASRRDHHQTGSILVLNLFLGWTALGWLAALGWAMSAVRTDMSKKKTKACPACAEQILNEAKVCRFCAKSFAV